MSALFLPQVNGFANKGCFEVAGTSYTCMENRNGTKVTLSEYGVARMRVDETFADMMERTSEIVDELDGYKGPKQIVELEPSTVLQRGKVFHPYHTDQAHRTASVYKPDAVESTVIKANDFESPRAYPLQFYAGNWIHRKLAVAPQDRVEAPANFALLESPSGHSSVVSEFVEGTSLWSALMQQFEDIEIARKGADILEEDIIQILEFHLGSLGVRLANDVKKASDGNIIVSGFENPLAAENLDEAIFTIIDQPHPTLRANALFRAMTKVDKRSSRYPHRLPPAHPN